MVSILQEESQARKELTDALHQLTAITPESLVRTTQLGTALDFSQGIEIFARTLSLFKGLQDSNLDSVPLETLRQLRNLVQQASSVFSQIQSFNPAGQGNPAATRDNLIQQVANQYQSWFQALSPVIAYSVRRGTDFDRLEREARGSLEELGRVRKEFDSKATAIIGEAQAALEQVRRAAAEVGVAQHAVHFRQEAADHLGRAWKWLAAAGAFALLTLGLAAWTIYYYATNTQELSTTQSVQLAISKVLAFSLLYFSIVWTARMYRAQWHNYVVNKHRQNALSTFETFVKAASDEQTKNAVLLQATQCIFSPQVTGFVTQESDGSPSPQILEIIRGSVGDRAGQ